MDIVLFIILVYRNSRIAREKGYNGAGYGFMTFGLLLGAELFGAVFGAFISGFDMMAVVLFAYMGIAVGAAVSYLIVRKLKPRVYPAGQQGFEGRPHQQYPPGSQFEAPVYSRGTAGGICGVCGRSVEAGEAYLVPADIFYSSQKYKDWLIQNPVTQAGVQSLGGPDKFLSYMWSKDQSTHAEVCPTCIGLFT